MTESEPIWVKSKWKADELENEAIEFRLPLKGNGIVYGFGILLARKRLDDRISVQIELKHQSQGLVQHQTGLLLSESYVDQIEFHPKQDIAKFRLMVA